MIKISGEEKVFQRYWSEGKGKNKREATFYSMRVASRKIEEGKKKDTYINTYYDVQFSKALEKKLPDKTLDTSFDVTIKDAWIKTYFSKKKDAEVPVIFINKATIVLNEDEEDDEDDDEDE